jgi:hypothetical protein
MWSTDIYRRQAAKWTRILTKCWQTRQPYEDAKWMESLKKRGSWLYEATQNVIKTNPKFRKAAGEYPPAKRLALEERFTDPLDTAASLTPLTHDGLGRQIEILRSVS